MGPKDPELLEIPGAEGLSVDFFKNLMNQAAPTMDIPLQQVAGLTGNEQTVQGLLSKYLGSSATEGEAYKAGMGEIQKTLGGEFYDPKTSDFWKGYRDYSEMEQEKGIATVRRRGQIGGGLFATPNQRVESEYVGEMGTKRTMMLGSLFEKERDRRSGAVNQALGYAGLEEGGKTSRIALGSTVGAIPRNVQNQQYQAAYNQSLGQEKADYASSMAEIGMQSGAAGALMPQWFVPGEGGGGAGFLGLLGSIIGGK
jgi:hypothetical protein